MWLPHATAQLSPRSDAQLAVDVREVDLDGLGADEQRPRHLPIRLPGGGKLRDSAFRGGEYVPGWCRCPDSGQLQLRALAPERSLQSLEDQQSPFERFSGGPSLMVAAQQLTAHEESSAKLERYGQAFVMVQSFGGRVEGSGYVALGRQEESPTAPSESECPCAIKSLTAVQQLGHQCLRLVVLADGNQRLCGVGRERRSRRLPVPHRGGGCGQRRLRTLRRLPRHSARSRAGCLYRVGERVLQCPGPTAVPRSAIPSSSRP